MRVDGFFGCGDILVGFLLFHEISVEVGGGEVFYYVSFYLGGEATAEVVEEIKHIWVQFILLFLFLGISFYLLVGTNMSAID